VFFVERHATPAQIRDNLPAVPGEILILKPQDLRDTSTLAVLADDILEQHSVQDIRAALMEATGKMAFLSRHFDGDVTLAFFLTYQYDPRPAELLGMWFRQFHGIEGDAS